HERRLRNAGADPGGCHIRTRPLSRARAPRRRALPRAAGRLARRISLARLEGPVLGGYDVRLAPDSFWLRCARLDPTPDRPGRSGGQSGQRLWAWRRTFLSCVPDRRRAGARSRDLAAPRRRNPIRLTPAAQSGSTTAISEDRDQPRRLHVDPPRSNP